jgi:hypothetical protein
LETKKDALEFQDLQIQRNKKNDLGKELSKIDSDIRLLDGQKTKSKDQYDFLKSQRDLLHKDQKR